MPNFDKLSFDDFFDPSKGKNAFNNIIKALEELNKLLGTTEDNIKGLSKEVEKDLIKALDKFESINSASNKELSETDKKLESVSKELVSVKKALSEVNKQQEKVNDTTKQANAVNTEAERLLKERTKLEAKLAASTTEQAKANAEIKLQISEANKQLKENAKESLGLIDNYTKLSKELNDNRKKWKNLAAAEKQNTKEGKELLKTIEKQDKALKDIDESVGQYQRNVGNYADAVGDLEQAFDGLQGNLDGIASGLNSLNDKMNISNVLSFAGAMDTLSGSLTSGSDTAEDMRRAGGKLEAVWDTWTGALGRSASGVIDLTEAIVDGNVTTGKLFSAYDKIIGSYKNMSDKTQKQVDAQTKLVDITIKSEKELRKLLITQAQQEGELQRLEILRDQESISLQERLVFAKQASQASVNLFETNRKIALEELQLAHKRVSVQKQADKVSLELLDALANAQAEYIRVNNDRQNAALEADKERKTLRDDIIEQDLDLMIDGADKIKSIGERIIADERIPLEERKKIAEKLRVLQDKTLADQVETLQKGAKTKIDIDSLLIESDSKKLKNQIQSTGLSERLTLRLLGIIKEEKTATQDLIDVKKDLFDVNQEQSTNPAVIKAQKERLEELKTFKQKESETLDEFQTRQEESALDYEETLLQIEIDGLNAEIAAREKLGQEINDLVIERNDLLLEQAETTAEREVAITERKNEALTASDKKRVEDQKKIANSAPVQALLDGLESRINAQFALAAAQAFRMAIEQGEDVKTATKRAASAVAAAAITKAFMAASAQGFHDGGYTGDNGEYQAVGVVHGQEHVITKNQTDKYSMKGWTASDLDTAIQNDYFSQFAISNNSVIDQKPVVVQQREEIDYKKIGQEVGKNIPSHNFKPLINGHFQHSETRGSKTISTIFKDKKRLR